MTAITAFLAKPAVKYGVLVLAVLAIAGFIYLKGERAGSSGVINAVQSESLKKLDAARKSKERTDEEVRRTPYDDRVDGMR